MFNTIWKIRREGVGYYRITLDPSSFGYDTFPNSDRGWTNDNVEELMKEARIVTQTHTQNQAFDHYGKIEEYGEIFFDVDEEVIQGVRDVGESNAKTSAGCLTSLSLILLLLSLILLLLSYFAYF